MRDKKFISYKDDDDDDDDDNEDETVLNKAIRKSKPREVFKNKNKSLGAPQRRRNL